MRVLLAFLLCLFCVSAFSQTKPQPMTPASIKIDGTNFVNFFSTPVNPKVAIPAPMREERDPAGFRYLDFAYGKGDSAAEGKRHFIRFIGTHANGDLFDTSHAGNVLYSFVMGSGEVMKGLELGIKTMKCGGRRQLIIPAQLAYDIAGYPSVGILENETLIIFVELVKVE